MSSRPSSSLPASSSSSPSPSTPSSASSTPAPPIPKIWRNNSLCRARQTIPAIEFELKTFAANTLGARFSEDFDAAGYNKDGEARTRSVAFVDNSETAQSTRGHRVPPRPSTPFAHDNALGQRLGSTIVETALYPVHRGYERSAFTHALESWIADLERLRAGYKSSLGLFTRAWLREYRQLSRRTARLIDALKELLALFRTVVDPDSCTEQWDGVTAECRVFEALLDEWVGKAKGRFAQVSALESPRRRRSVVLEMREGLEGLAGELKEVLLERVGEVVRNVACREVEGGGCLEQCPRQAVAAVNLGCFWRRRAWSVDRDISGETSES